MICSICAFIIREGFKKSVENSTLASDPPTHPPSVEENYLCTPLPPPTMVSGAVVDVGGRWHQWWVVFCGFCPTPEQPTQPSVEFSTLFFEPFPCLHPWTSFIIIKEWGHPSFKWAFETMCSGAKPGLNITRAGHYGHYSSSPHQLTCKFLSEQ